MRSFCARFLIVLLAAALAGGGPALAEPLGSGIVDPIRHEVTGVGSGSFEALLKKHKVPPEIRDAVLRSFELDPDFPRRLPKQSEFRLVYEELPPALEEADPRLVLR